MDFRQSLLCPWLPGLRVRGPLYSQLLSCVWTSVAPWSVACQALLSIEFSRQESWSGLHFLLPGALGTQGWNLCLLRLWHEDERPGGALRTPGHCLGCARGLLAKQSNRRDGISLGFREGRDSVFVTKPEPTGCSCQQPPHDTQSVKEAKWRRETRP